MLIFLIIFVIAFAAVCFYFFRKKLAREKFNAVLNMKLFLIRLPLSSKEGKDLKQEVNLSEQLFSSLLSFKAPVVFEAAVPYVGEEIHFYVAVPEKWSEPLVRQITSLWNDGQVEPVEDYNIFNYSGFACGAWVAQKERFAMPVRTYTVLNADTFLPLLGGLTTINEVGEGGAIQIVIQPGKTKHKKEINATLNALKKGAKLKDILKGGAISFSDIGQALSSKNSKEKGNNDKPVEKIIEESAIKALEMKLSKPLFEVN